MRALLIVAAGRAVVDDVEDVKPTAGQAVIRVEAAGVCGTDVALACGDPARIDHVRSSYPLRLGHEWVGVVERVADAAHSAWIGKRVVGAPILGCGSCAMCQIGMEQLCPDRHEVGVRRNYPGAFAERLAVPVSSLHALPDSVAVRAGALVEPAANAWRAWDATGRPQRVLVIGGGTIGILAAQLATADGAEVALQTLDDVSDDRARAAGVVRTGRAADLADATWDAVIDASNGASAPAEAATAVRPGGTISLVGVADEPSLLDTRSLVRHEVSVRTVMGGNAGFAPVIDALARGAIDPEPLVSAELELDELAEWFNSGSRIVGTRGTKVLVRPNGQQPAAGTERNGHGLRNEA